MRIAIVKAAFGDSAGVWYVEHSDIEGLHAEGQTFEVFRRAIADAASEIIAHVSVRTHAAA